MKDIDQRDWFDTYGERVVDVRWKFLDCTDPVSVEDMYQAFAARMKAEAAELTQQQEDKQLTREQWYERLADGDLEPVE